MKKRITIDEEDIITLAHIMDHFTDYMAHDDRPDHGFGILKGYRDLDDARKSHIYFLAGRLMRYARKIREKRAEEWREKYEKENENES